ncbi:MAG: hypothetical protein A2W26_12315 [Acidobacteria bacterium RBG_16_64_8]|nr:MAG: hypothetical protein A2W26_12315 [Acidobacteria bacterium RBG_16_64_8]
MGHRGVQCRLHKAASLASRMSSNVGCIIGCFALALAALGGVAACRSRAPGRLDPPTKPVHATRIGTVHVDKRRAFLAALPGTDMPGEEIYSPQPLVLWRGTAPALVLQHCYEQSVADRYLGERFATVGGEPSQSKTAEKHPGVFPVTHGCRLKQDVRDTPVEDANLTDPYSMLMADVDGDGRQEMVVVRAQGGIEVYGTERLLAKTEAPPLPRPEDARYRPLGISRTRVGRRDVVLVRLDLVPRLRASLFGFGGRPESGWTDEDAHALGAANALLFRIDARGVTRVQLTDMPFVIDRLAGAGAVERPGAPDGYEIVIVSEPESLVRRRTVVSRHRADGRLIGAVQELPEPISRSAQLAGIAGSDTIVVTEERANDVWFFRNRPEGTTFRKVALPDSWGCSLRGAIDPGHPKALVKCAGSDHAIDEAGVSFVHSPTGWVAAPGAKPIGSMERPSPQHDAPQVFFSPERDESLVVSSRQSSEEQPTAETVFTLIRGGAPATTFSVPGYIDPAWSTHGIGTPIVNFRTGEGEISIVLPLEPPEKPVHGGEEERYPVAFWLVRATFQR